MFRRDLLISGALAPLLASCATDPARWRLASVAELAAARGVCSVAYATLKAGAVDRVETLSGCGAAEPPRLRILLQPCRTPPPAPAG